jgi:hypothetical protein
VGKDDYHQVVYHQARKKDIDVAEKPMAGPDNAIYGERYREKFQ